MSTNWPFERELHEGGGKGIECWEDWEGNILAGDEGKC